MGLAKPPGPGTQPAPVLCPATVLACAGPVGGGSGRGPAVRDHGCTDWLIGAIIVTLGVGLIVVWLMA